MQYVPSSPDPSVSSEKAAKEGREYFYNKVFKGNIHHNPQYCYILRKSVRATVSLMLQYTYITDIRWSLSAVLF